MNQSTISHPLTESGGSPSVFLSTSYSLFLFHVLFHVHIYMSNFIWNRTSSNCQFSPLPLLLFQSPRLGTRSVAVLPHHLQRISLSSFLSSHSSHYPSLQHQQVFPGKHQSHSQGSSRLMADLLLFSPKCDVTISSAALQDLTCCGLSPPLFPSFPGDSAGLGGTPCSSPSCGTSQALSSFLRVSP